MHRTSPPPQGLAVHGSSTRDAGWDRPWLVSLCTVLLVFTWVALAARWHTALHHDMAEQFVWAQAWQLGYPKHPPLPTWLFLLAKTVFPAVPATLYGLAALCIGLTGAFTYLAARELIGHRMALCVVWLWGLMQPFGWRAWIYNHNTVLVMTVAMLVYFTARAVRRQEPFSWAAAGLAAGLAMSTKLQAIVPLAGVLWALWRSGALDSLAARKGLASAVVLAALVSAPPLIWMATGHTNALAYATHQLGSGEAEGDSLRLGQFVVSELRMLAPALVVLLIWVLRSYGRDRDREASGGSANWLDEGQGASLYAWIQGLLFLPLAFVLAMGLLGGAKMHAQWGVQTFQFAPIALVAWFGHFFNRASTRSLFVVTAIVQAALLLVGASPVSGRLHAPGAVQGYPARELADRVEADWQRLAPGCPLRYIDAPFFEGGQMAAFGPSSLKVFLDGGSSAASQVDMADVRARGSVVMRKLASELPADAIHTPEMSLEPSPRVKGVNEVVWGIRRPTAACASGAR